MRLYEYEAKQLFAAHGIPIPKGFLTRTFEEVASCVERIGGKVVLKAQILSGGRGKAGGVLFASLPEEAAEKAKSLLGASIKGYPVKSIYVEQALDITKEFYIGVTIDRVHYKVVLIGCEEGGVEIEEIARRSPEKVVKISRDIDEPFFPHDGITFAKQIGFSGKMLQSVAQIAKALVDIFYQYDAKLVEINPLAQLQDGSLVAADARMSIDEDALFRQPALQKLGVEDRHEEGEMTDREKEAREAGIPYLDLEGDIGMFPGGAGFGIAGNDLIIDLGGEPANFMDSGGGPSPERIAKMLMLLEENPRVKAIFGARFGGVSRCDDFAKGVVMFLKTGRLTKPIAMRMTGNMWEEGLRIFEEERKQNPQLFEHVEIYGIETPIEYVAKRAVELARGEERKKG
jgi:succinyl-CoA synthetase beta subunit